MLLNQYLFVALRPKKFLLNRQGYTLSDSVAPKKLRSENSAMIRALAFRLKCSTICTVPSFNCIRLLENAVYPFGRAAIASNCFHVHSPLVSQPWKFFSSLLRRPHLGETSLLGRQGDDAKLRDWNAEWQCSALSWRPALVLLGAISDIDMPIL